MMLGAVAAFVLSFAAVPFQSADAAAFHQGESGPEVAAIQEKLLMEGYDIGIPDGVYGERTVDAIKKYQASMGLEVDGIIGDSTYMKLMGKRMPQYAGYGVSRGRSYRGSGAARRLISRAFEYVGVPYVFGERRRGGLTAPAIRSMSSVRLASASPEQRIPSITVIQRFLPGTFSPVTWSFLKRMNRVPPMSGSILATARCFRLVPVRA